MADKKPDDKKAENRPLVSPPPPAPKASLGREIIKGFEAKKKGKDLEKGE